MFRLFALLAFTMILMVPAEASAQRRGGYSGGRGWNGYQEYSSPGYGSWNQGNNWNQSGYRNYYGGYSGYGLGLGLGGIYGGYNSYPYGYYGQSGYSYYPGTRYSSGYYDPSANVASSYPDTTSNRARIEVFVPDANAELIIQGQRMDTTGRSRAFVSPDLTTGKTYTYTITMPRMINGRSEDDTRKVEVQAGSTSTVDFNVPVSQQAPRPDSTRVERTSPFPR